MDRVIEAQGLEKRFGAQKVLSGIDLSIRPGEAVALMGENGAGKSTLLGILATALRPDRGKVLYFGRQLHENDDEIHRRIGWLGHQSMLYSDLTARENLLFFARLYGVPFPQKRVERVLEQMGLAQRQGQVVRTFSRGMLQRLAIGRTFLHDPQMLLLDEPFTGLDQKNKVLVEALFSEWRAQKKAIVFSTHDFSQAAAFSEHVLILNKSGQGELLDTNLFDADSLRKHYESAARKTEGGGNAIH